MCVGGPMLGEDYVNGNCQGHCRLAGSVFRTFYTDWSNSLSTSTAMLFPFSFFTTQGMRLRRASMATCISYRGGGTGAPVTLPINLIADGSGGRSNCI